MIKNKLLIKKLNKILLSINKLIESFFNKFDFLFLLKNIKKDLTKIDNKNCIRFWYFYYFNFKLLFNSNVL